MKNNANGSYYGGQTALTSLENQMTADKEVNFFLSKYESQAGLTNEKQYARRIPISYRDWQDRGAYIPFHQEVEREPMVKMYMPKHRFRELVEREDYLTRLEQDRNYNQSVVNMLRADERVRDENPAVAKAYRNYLMLLELARK